MIPTISTVESFQRAFQEIKTGALEFSTTYFGPPAQIQDWISKGEVEFHRVPGALLILKRDRDFRHLHHVAADPSALAQALCSLPSNWDSVTLVADLVGRPQDVEPLVLLYAGSKFHQHNSLIRMARLGPPSITPLDSPEIDFANPAEGLEILAFLERLLDRFAEQIPLLEDLQKCASRKRILVSRIHGQVAGVLIYEHVGRSALLQFWHVDGKYRGAGIGASLIRKFFDLSQTSSRFILWVIADNQESIAKYLHYGFHPENAVDQIMIRRSLA